MERRKILFTAERHESPELPVLWCRYFKITDPPVGGLSVLATFYAILKNKS